MKCYNVVGLLLAVAMLRVNACPEQCICSSMDADYIVDCSSNDLDSIPSSIPFNTTVLNLSNNSIQSIGNNSFGNLIDLRNLDLSNNIIDTLGTEAFNGLENLQKLDLSYNGLEHLDHGKEILKPLVETKNIELSNNELKSLQHGLFEKCVRLRSLGLANNMLTMEDLDALNTPSGLTHLDISGNSIGRLPYRMFYDLGLLQSLTIRNASVNSIDPNAFVDLKKSIEVLDLTENNIQRIKREMFQPMETGVFNGVSLAANQIVCDCGTKQFQDWLNDFQPVLDEATCTSPGGTVYNIKDDDLTTFCGAKGLNPGCSVNSSITVTLVTVNTNSAHVEHQQRELPYESIVHVQLKEIGSQQIIKTVDSSADDAVHEFEDLERSTGYSVCAANTDCAVWDCVTFSTTSVSPTVAALTDCADLGLVVGLTVGGCVFSFVIIVAVVLLLYNAAIISCYCLRHKSGGSPAQYNYGRRRSTKYGATVYSDYEAGGDNNYEAILNRKYEVPDELPPVPGTRLPGIHLMSLPPIPESRARNTEDFPVQLPPKKKPIHFIRDPNFLAHGTAAHGETYLEPMSTRDSIPSSGASSPGVSSNHDRKGVPLPSIPESSVRRNEKVESYLESTPTNTLRKDWNWNDDPANQNISTIAHAHYQPQFVKEPDRQTYLEPTDSYHDDFNLGISLNPNRQTADFTRGISLKFDENRRESGDSNSNHPPTDINHGSVNSGILLNPSEQDSRGTKADLVPVKSTKNIKPKSEKKKKKDRLSLQNTEDEAENSSTKKIPNPGKKRGSIQFTDDIYLQIEQDSSSA